MAATRRRRALGTLGAGGVALCLAATYQAAATDLGVTAAAYQAEPAVTKGSTATAPGT